MKQKPVKPILTAEARTAVLNKAFGYFTRGINTYQAAQEYLKQRGLDSKQITVGYDSGLFHRKAGKNLRESYYHTGLLKQDRLKREGYHHSFFKDCIVFPLLDEQGNVASLYGRHTQQEGHYYLPGGHQGLYPGYPNPETITLIITEAIIDCATLQQCKAITDKYSLLSLYGTNGFNGEHEKAIKELHQLQEVILFFDGDQAGEKAAEKYKDQIGKLKPGIKLSAVQTPQNEDINSLAQGHEPELLTELIDNRKVFLSSETDKGGSRTPFKNNNNSEQNKTSYERQNGQGVNKAAQPEDPGRLDTQNRDNITYETTELKITLWGGIELHNLKRLRVTLHIQRKPALSGVEGDNQYQDYRDTIDLYSNSGRKRLIQEASETLEINSQTITKIITDLTNRLEQYRQGRREQQRKKEEALKNKDKETFTSEQIRAGENLLKEKNLMQTTYNHIKQIGLIGQEQNGMLLYFIYLTRMSQEPLHALVQGKSGSGKTYLLKKIISLVPKQQYKNITAITENALYYIFEGVLKHIILLLEDLEGSYGALLPIRELMTNLSISKWTTITNQKTGEPEQKELFVEGPACIAGATTKDRIYEDNANRSFLIQIEETPDQERKILEHQRNHAAGLIDKVKTEQIQATFKTAQLQLKKVSVIIPFARELIIPEYVFKKYRTNQHYLTLIKSITFWHQKQRPWKKDKHGNYYIESNFNDVHWANQLCKESLLSKSDELSPQLRAFFERLKDHLLHHNVTPESGSFYAKDIRQSFRMNPMQVNRYLRELDARNYIKKSGGNQKMGYQYMIKLWDEYKELQQGIDILDEILENLKVKYNTPKGVNA